MNTPSSIITFYRIDKDEISKINRLLSAQGSGEGLNAERNAEKPKALRTALDFEYKVLDNNTVEITKYTGKGDIVKIPDRINGIPVTKLGNRAFERCSSLTEVVIPNSVTTIRDSAFYGCSSLTNVVIPNSVTKIGDWAFFGCTSLTEVVIPNSVTTIGLLAFAGCDNLVIKCARSSKAEEYARLYKIKCDSTMR